MSLRLRLALVVVALVSVGLLVADVVTYVSLRSFLSVRLDQQLQQALGPIANALQTGSAPGATSVPGMESLPTEPADTADGVPAVPPGGPALLLPPGTYGELRAPDGSVIRRVQFNYGDASLAVPDLSEALPEPDPGRRPTREIFTVSAAGGGAGGFRVLTVPRPGGPGLMVAAVPLSDMTNTLDRLLLVEALLTAGVLAGLALLSWWMVRRGLRPLERMGDTAEAIAGGDLTRRVEPADPRTEVGRLGMALNTMLAQIESGFSERLASEERLRRFLADASHELRTPITSIRGYAELFRRGASERPEDLAVSIRRIEQEAARMGTLVEDMLLLARLDQRRPLEAAPIDVAALAADAVQDARVADPARAIALAAPSPVMILGDGDRLRQVISNLISNALAHTPAGSPVDIDVLAADGWARLEVADRGRGLAPGDAARVFEPFFRADQGRSRDEGGSGLGLSIVAAIASAHGGRVEVEPRSGGGSVFRVWLPSLGGPGEADAGAEDAAPTAGSEAADPADSPGADGPGPA